MLFAGLIHGGVPVADTLIATALGSVAAAGIAWRLHRACRPAFSSA